MKKIITLIMIFALIISAFSVSIYAEGEQLPSETVIETPDENVGPEVEGKAATTEEIKEIITELTKEQSETDKIDYIVGKFGYIGIIALVVCIVLLWFVKYRLIPKISNPVSSLSNAIPEYFKNKGADEAKSLEAIKSATGEILGAVKDFSELGCSVEQLKNLYGIVIESLRENSEMLNVFVQKSNASQAVKDEVEKLLKKREEKINSITEGGDKI